MRPLLLDIGVAEETIAAAQQKDLICSYQVQFSEVPLLKIFCY